MSASEIVGGIGILVSVLIAVLVYVLERRAEESARTVGAKVNALTIGLLGLNLTLMVAHSFDFREVLGETVPTVESATWSVVVRDIAALDGFLEQSSVPVGLQEVAMAPLREVVSRSINEAKQGRIGVSTIGQTINVASSLMSQAGKEILVTSYISPAEWWTTSLGDEYDNLIRPSPRRVSNFERLYIVDTEAELASLRPVMERQVRDGVRVGFVWSRNVEPDLRRDFVVVDGVIAGEMELDGERRFVRGIFFPSKVVANDYVSRFRELRFRSQRFESVQQ